MSVYVCVCVCVYIYKIKGYMCYELNSIPQNPYVEALTSSVTVLGRRAFKEVINLNDIIRVVP